MYRALLLSYGQDQVLAVVRFLLNSKLRYEPILQAQALKSKSVWCGLVYSQIEPLHVSRIMMRPT